MRTTLGLGLLFVTSSLAGCSCGTPCAPQFNYNATFVVSAIEPGAGHYHYYDSDNVLQGPCAVIRGIRTPGEAGTSSSETTFEMPLECAMNARVTVGASLPTRSESIGNRDLCWREYFLLSDTAQAECAHQCVAELPPWDASDRPDAAASDAR